MTNSTPLAHVGRDLDVGLAHLRTWWATHKQDLPPAARLIRKTDLSLAFGISVLTTKRPSLATLDQLYVAFRTVGYRPLPDTKPVAPEIPAVVPSPVGGATFDWFNPRAGH